MSSYRTHPFVVLRGGTIKSLIGELLGRVSGVSKGKGGSMHVFTEAFQGGHGIVGAQVPLGAGLAFAEQYLGRKNATFSLLVSSVSPPSSNLGCSCATPLSPRLPRQLLT